MPSSTGTFCEGDQSNKCESRENVVSMEKLEAGQQQRSARRPRLQLAAEPPRRASLNDIVFENKDGGWTAQMSLFTDARIMKRSLVMLKFAVICDAINYLILEPNVPIIVLPGAHPESFNNTHPFDFSTATYFISLTLNIGAAIASVAAGKLSDNWGRKNVIMMNLFANAIFTGIKYLVRHSFWLFSVTNFFVGLSSSCVPVALAYMSDVHIDRKKKDAACGEIMALSLMGRAGGGIIAALMSKQGLFVPLWVSFSLLLFAGILCVFFLVEPDKDMFKQNGMRKPHREGQNMDDQHPCPKALDKLTLWHVLFGAIADNVGSAGLIPMCLTPLMFEVYYSDFVQNGMSPIMSAEGYKYIYALIAFVVAPGAAVSPVLFKKYGPALCCSAANFFTGLLILALLYLSRVEASSVTFALFVSILYAGFPLAVISQISTGPMLDRISPPDQRGYVQGLNMMIINATGAVTPFLLSILYDNLGALACYWTAAAASFVATLINAPLSFNPSFGPAKIKSVEDINLVDFVEDEDLIISRLDQAEYVPSDVLVRTNRNRMERGDPMLMTRYGNYHDESCFLPIEHECAVKEYAILQKMAREELATLKAKPYVRDLLADSINSLKADYEGTLQSKKEVGEWFAEYLIDNGYHPGEASTLIKHMIMTAFPTLTENGEVTAENIEDHLLRKIKNLNNLIALEEDLTLSEEVTTMLSGISLGGSVALFRTKTD